MEIAFKDLAEFLVQSKIKYPNLPLFLYGHSLGGAIVLNYALRFKPDLAGIIATSPGLATGEKVASWKLTLGKLLYSLMPTFSMPNGLDVDNISRDKEVVKRYKEDPLVHNKVSARFGLDFINAGTWASEHAAEFSLPLLLLYGTGDHIVSADAIHAFAEKAPGITFKEWDGYYHELHNEPEKGEVLDYIDQWINSKMR
jgi:alpha-beta hydrolase superfamily lysophospholipase